jgi:lysophospholipase L1-like esterase
MDKVALLFVALSILLVGCAGAVTAPAPTAKPTATTPASLRYLALGDSYTVGEMVSVNQRFPVLLANGLRKNGIPIENPQIIATTGWTTDELDAGIDEVNPQGTFDLVTLLIGVNNQYRGRDLDEYRQQFHGLLVRAIAFAGERPEHVIVISIPDWGVTPFAGGKDELKIADEIDAFNAVNRAEAELLGARYVNITEISRLAYEDTTLLARDKLHPSGKMYRMWVEVLMPEALEILQ